MSAKACYTGELRTPLSMRTAFNRPERHEKRILVGGRYQRLDPAAAGLLAWFKAEQVNGVAMAAHRGCE